MSGAPSDDRRSTKREPRWDVWRGLLHLLLVPGRELVRLLVVGRVRQRLARAGRWKILQPRTPRPHAERRAATLAAGSPQQQLQSSKARRNRRCIRAAGGRASSFALDFFFFFLIPPTTGRAPPLRLSLPPTTLSNDIPAKPTEGCVRVRDAEEEAKQHQFSAFYSKNRSHKSISEYIGHTLMRGCREMRAPRSGAVQQRVMKIGHDLKSTSNAAAGRPRELRYGPKNNASGRGPPGSRQAPLGQNSGKTRGKKRGWELDPAARGRRCAGGAINAPSAADNRRRLVGMLGVSALAQPARLCLAPGAARRGARQSVGGKPARFAVLAKKAEAEAEPKEKKDKGDKKEKKEKETNGDAAPARKSQKFDPTKRSARHKLSARAPSRGFTHARCGPSISLASRIKVDLSLEELAKVALRAQHDHVYEKSLQILQIELVKLQARLRDQGVMVPPSSAWIDGSPAARCSAAAGGSCPSLAGSSPVAN